MLVEQFFTAEDDGSWSIESENGKCVCTILNGKLDGRVELTGAISGFFTFSSGDFDGKCDIKSANESYSGLFVKNVK